MVVFLLHVLVGEGEGMLGLLTDLAIFTRQADRGIGKVLLKIEVKQCLIFVIEELGKVLA